MRHLTLGKNFGLEIARQSQRNSIIDDRALIAIRNSKENYLFWSLYFSDFCPRFNFIFSNDFKKFCNFKSKFAIFSFGQVTHVKFLFFNKKYSQRSVCTLSSHQSGPCKNYILVKQNFIQLTAS